MTEQEVGSLSASAAGVTTTTIANHGGTTSTQVIFVNHNHSRRTRVGGRNGDNDDDEGVEATMVLSTGPTTEEIVRATERQRRSGTLSPSKSVEGNRNNVMPHLKPPRAPVKKSSSSSSGGTNGLRLPLQQSLSSEGGGGRLSQNRSSNSLHRQVSSRSTAHSSGRKKKSRRKGSSGSISSRSDSTGGVDEELRRRWKRQLSSSKIKWLHVSAAGLDNDFNIFSSSSSTSGLEGQPDSPPELPSTSLCENSVAPLERRDDEADERQRRDISPHGDPDDDDDTVPVNVLLMDPTRGFYDIIAVDSVSSQQQSSQQRTATFSLSAADGDDTATASEVIDSVLLSVFGQSTEDVQRLFQEAREIRRRRQSRKDAPIIEWGEVIYTSASAAEDGPGNRIGSPPSEDTENNTDGLVIRNSTTTSGGSSASGPWKVRYDALVQCRANKVFKPKPSPSTSPLPSRGLSASDGESELQGKKEGSSSSTLSPHHRRRPIAMINCVRLSKYDVRPDEVLIAKPVGMTVRDAAIFSESLLDHLYRVGVIRSMETETDIVATLAKKSGGWNRYRRSLKDRPDKENEHILPTLRCFSISFARPSENSSKTTKTAKESSSETDGNGVIVSDRTSQQLKEKDCGRERKDATEEAESKRTSTEDATAGEVSSYGPTTTSETRSEELQSLDQRDEQSSTSPELKTKDFSNDSDTRLAVAMGVGSGDGKRGDRSRSKIQRNRPPALQPPPHHHQQPLRSAGSRPPRPSSLSAASRPPRSPSVSSTGKSPTIKKLRFEEQRGRSGAEDHAEVTTQDTSGSRSFEDSGGGFAEGGAFFTLQEEETKDVVGSNALSLVEDSENNNKNANTESIVTFGAASVEDDEGARTPPSAVVVVPLLSQHYHSDLDSNDGNDDDTPSWTSSRGSTPSYKPGSFEAAIHAPTIQRGSTRSTIGGAALRRIRPSLSLPSSRHYASDGDDVDGRLGFPSRRRHWRGSPGSTAGAGNSSSNSVGSNGSRSSVGSARIIRQLNRSIGSVARGMRSLSKRSLGDNAISSRRSNGSPNSNSSNNNPGNNSGVSGTRSPKDTRKYSRFDSNEEEEEDDFKD